MPYKDKEKQREAQRLWASKFRKKNPEYRQYLNKLREENKAKLKKLKESQPCKDCGNKHPSYVMHYDHLEEFYKEDSVSRMVSCQTWERVLEEISKCDLVCANCHAERTHRRLVS